MVCDVITNIGVRGDQPGAVFTADHLERAYEGIDVFRRQFPFKMLQALLPGVLRHAVFKSLGVIVFINMGGWLETAKTLYFKKL